MREWFRPRLFDRSAAMPVTVVGFPRRLDRGRKRFKVRLL